MKINKFISINDIKEKRDYYQNDFAHNIKEIKVRKGIYFYNQIHSTINNFKIMKSKKIPHYQKNYCFSQLRILETRLRREFYKYLEVIEKAIVAGLTNTFLLNRLKYIPILPISLKKGKQADEISWLKDKINREFINCMISGKKKYHYTLGMIVNFLNDDFKFIPSWYHDVTNKLIWDNWNQEIFMYLQQQQNIFNKNINRENFYNNLKSIVALRNRVHHLEYFFNTIKDEQKLFVVFKNIFNSQWKITIYNDLIYQINRTLETKELVIEVAHIMLPLFQDDELLEWKVNSVEDLIAKIINYDAGQKRNINSKIYYSWK